MTSYLKTTLTLTTAIIFLTGCNNNDEKDPVADGAFSEGVIVINGGNFSQNNGTFSFLKRESSRPTENIYNLVNGQASLPPEDGRIEGYTEAGETGMILFDHTSVGEDKLVFVDASSFERKSELQAPVIENPRDVLAINTNKVYVTNWDSFNADWTYKEGFITVVNPETRESGKRINLGQGPENMVLHQNKVYVGRAAWTSNDLTIVDTNTDEVLKSLTFAGWPDPVGIDANGKLWIKEGNRFHRINTGSDEIESTIEAGQDAGKSIGVATLTADKQHIVFVLSYEDENYLEVGSTYLFNISASSISVEAPAIDRVFSALAADPVSGTLYGGITPSFVQAGYVFRVSPAGVLQDSVKVEIGPEGFYFK